MMHLPCLRQMEVTKPMIRVRGMYLLQLQLQGSLATLPQCVDARLLRGRVLMHCPLTQLLFDPD